MWGSLRLAPITFHYYYRVKNKNLAEFIGSIVFSTQLCNKNIIIIIIDTKFLVPLLIFVFQKKVGSVQQFSCPLVITNFRTLGDAIGVIIA